MDLAPFSAPEITVGEHAYELDANRWGTKFNYAKGSLDFEAGYMYEGETVSSNWSASTDFANTDKTFQYKLAYAINSHTPIRSIRWKPASMVRVVPGR